MLENASDQVQQMPLADDMALIRAEIMSPFNRWVTGQEIGHEPAPRECAEHYMEHGGVEEHRRHYRIRPPDIVEADQIAA